MRVLGEVLVVIVPLTLGAMIVYFKNPRVQQWKQRRRIQDIEEENERLDRINYRESRTRRVK